MAGNLRIVEVLVYCAGWYLSSAATNTIAKEIFQYFNFPVTLSYLQFFFVAFYSALISKISNSSLAKHPFNAPHSIIHPSVPRNNHNTSIYIPITSIQYLSRQVLVKMFPLALFLISGHVFSSIAISKSSVSFVHTIKALSPLFTVLIYRLFHAKKYSNQLYIALIPLTFGVMLVCSYEISFDLIGLVCSICSTLIFVMQNIFSKNLFREKSLDKLSMLFYSSFLSFILMTPVWWYSEGHIFLNQFINSLYISPEELVDTKWILCYLFLNGSTHFAQNVLAFIILSMVSPVTYSIASLFKRIVVIVVSILWFSQHVNFTQVFGIAMTFFGLYLYNFAKQNVSKIPFSPPATSHLLFPQQQNQLLTHRIVERLRNFDVVRDDSSDSLYDSGNQPEILKTDEDVVISVSAA